MASLYWIAASQAGRLSSNLTRALAFKGGYKINIIPEKYSRVEGLLDVRRESAMPIFINPSTLEQVLQ